MSPRVLIAGCGRLGTRLGHRLAENGASVWGLRRRAEPLDAPLQTLRADLTRPRTLAGQLPSGLDLVYYILTPAAYDDTAYRDAFVSGLGNLLDALGAQRGRQAPRLIFVASTGVYGQDDGSWVDEASPTTPQTFSGRRLLEAEGRLAQAAVHGVSVRFAGIYGRERDRLLRRVREGAGCSTNPPRWTNRIHEDDAVGALAHLGQLPRPHACYVGVDDEPAEQCTVMDWLAQRLSVPVPPREPNPRGGRNKRCDNRRLRGSGYVLRYPTFREGYAAMLEDS